MKLHPDELAFAQDYHRATPFEELNGEQFKLIMERGRALHRWFKENQYIHFIISFMVIAFLFSLDAFVLLLLPRLFFKLGNGLGITLLCSLIIGCIHSWIMYSLVVYSIHEGAAHNLIFPPRGHISRLLNGIANNLCRIAFADPTYYSSKHLSHHSKFGTEEDGEFLNFVLRRRFWMSFLPFGVLINYSDFVIHRPLSYSRSRVYSTLVTLSYNAIYGYLMIEFFGLLFTFFTLVLFSTHFGFYMDRLRHFSEHNLMPLENKNGARSFGLGFWGLLIGGGPWGQACHWMHHLVPSIPWYQQLILHRYVVNLLTPRQREQFVLQPLIGYPKLLWRLWKEPNSFVSRAKDSPVEET